MTFDKNQTVREIAVKNPATVRVFENFGIDYCCGGKYPLQEACQTANAPIDKVLQALDELQASDIVAEERPWTQCSLADLTAHIVARHHRYVRDEAPRIEVLLQKVVIRHGDAHPELGVIQETFVALAQELSVHMMKEERVLFPFLEEMEIAAREGWPAPPGCFASVEMPISRMLADHDDAGALLAKMRDLSGGYRAPDGSCPSYRGLYQALEEFERDLHRHIHLENNILFPRAVEMEHSLQETAHVSPIDITVSFGNRAAPFVERERQLQRLVTAYIVAGLLFMLLPGMFLRGWNLLSISAQHTVESLSPAWLQAHGHAQIFGWLGTFILGIGFYSLSKMGNLQPFAVSRGWLAFGFWTVGVSLRWMANITAWVWRGLLPFSASLELAGFLLFFLTVIRHRPASQGGPPRRKEVWMIVVIGSTMAFLMTLLVNFGAAIYVALYGDSPALSFRFDQRLLLLPTWGFLVPTVWGFNARWLPTFLGIRVPRAKPLYAALLAAWVGVALMLPGFAFLSTICLVAASVLAVRALGIFEQPVQPGKLNGVHPSFPMFIRAAYLWLLTASLLSVVASLADREGGIWGASRHALTVGFLATMVFSIGPKILPAFCGARILFSPKLMFLSLVLLNAGCLFRVCSEIGAYEGYASHAWSVLPVSAVIELAAVTVFALNLGVTFLRPPAHLMQPARVTQI